IAILKAQLLANGQARGAAADVAMGDGAELGADAAAVERQRTRRGGNASALLSRSSHGACGNHHIEKHIEPDKQERGRIRAEMQLARPLAARPQSISDSMERAPTSMGQGKKSGAEAGRLQPAVDTSIVQMDTVLGAIGAGQPIRQQEQALVVGLQAEEAAAAAKRARQAVKAAGAPAAAAGTVGAPRQSDGLVAPAAVAAAQAAAAPAVPALDIADVGAIRQWLM
ncbi:unnamed protein product, partial [Prorocentrum cordatum]